MSSRFFISSASASAASGPFFPHRRSSSVLLVVLACLVSFASSGPSMTERHVRSSSERMAIPRPKPSFLHTDSDLTVQEGQHAFLNCKIRNIYNETVSWVRGKDSHILYIGDVRFVDDSRFELIRGRDRKDDDGDGQSGGGDIHRRRSFFAGDWTLKVRFVQAEDEGDFECQLSTSPKLSKTFRINVVVPTVRIDGGDPEMYVESGSSVVLRCHISNWLQKPQIVFWFRDGQRIATSPSGDTEVETSLGRDAIDSRLTIARAAAARHSGTYECSPDNIKPAKINLHVVEDENAAAMQKGVSEASTHSASSTPLMAALLLSLLFAVPRGILF